jgi:hypothetical protein
MNLLRRKPRARIGGYRRSPAVTIRWATPADVPRVNVLAELDDARVPPAPLLLAFVGEELWVAASPGTGAVICDPFRPSADVATLVRERGRQLTVPELGRIRTRVARPVTHVPEAGW